MGDDADNNLAAPTVVKEKLNQNGSVEVFLSLNLLLFSDRLRNNVYFHRRRWLNGDSVQAVVLRETEIESGVRGVCTNIFLSG